MPNLASGSRVRVGYAAEPVARGTAPVTPITLKTLRLVGRDINFAKNILQSNEVRPDRQISDVRHGVQRVEGTLNWEHGLSTFDDMLEALTGGTWTTVTIAATGNVGITTGTNVITRASGSFITDGMRVGDVLKTATFVNPVNNGSFTVLSFTATTATVDPGTGITFITEAPAAGPVLSMPGKRLDVGTLLKTFTFERQFQDIAQNQSFNGVAISNAQVTIKPEAIVTVQAGLVGMVPNPMSATSITVPGGGSYSAAPTNSPFSSFEGSMYEGTVKTAIVTGLDFKMENSRVLGSVVGSKFSPDVFDGIFMVDGTISLYFQDAVLFNKFANETESSLWCRLNDINGLDYQQIVIPRVKYNGATITPPATGPIIVPVPFKGLVSTVTGTTISFQRSN